MKLESWHKSAMISTRKAVFAVTSCYLLPTCRFTVAAVTSSNPSAFLIPHSNRQIVSRTLRNMSSSTTSTSDAETSLPIAENLSQVQERIKKAITSTNRAEGSVRLIAVSKTKPVELLQAAYDAGIRTFGENYAQELITKAPAMPADCKFHFIGPLQSNKAAPLVKSLGLDSLQCVETVCTLKLANKLNNAVSTLQEEGEGGGTKQLGIYLQVNTSGEESKSGLKNAQETVELATKIQDSCPFLRIDGLMTIGAPGDYTCFDTLANCRLAVSESLGVEETSLELSMGELHIVIF